jgi:ubiquitin carboxyl-terminal hydrolase 22/27/51
MCSHMSEYYTRFGTKPYQLVVSYFSAPLSKEKRRISVAFGQCLSCKSIKTSGLLSCLHCIYFGCRTHIIEHFKSKKHYIAANLTHGHLFCFNCFDYIYDHKFLKIYEKSQYKAAKTLKKSVSFMPWFPSESEISCLQQHSRKILSDSRLGLRGLFNLGNSCFMNCIIQVLIHTPVLRDYFLSDSHSCKLQSCMVCEISKIFQEFYSGKTSPISLHDLLFLIWKNAR